MASTKNLDLKGLIAQISTLLDRKLDEKLVALPNKNDFKAIEIGLVKTIQENMAMKEEIKQLKVKNEVLERKLDWLDVKSKERNLVFWGIQDEGERNKVKVIRELCEMALGVCVNIAKAYRVGGVQVAKCNLILVEFISIAEVKLVMKNAGKLKGTGIRIQPDLTYKQRMVRKHLLKFKRAVQYVDKNAKMFLTKNCLWYRGQRIFWTEEEGLKVQDKNLHRLVEQFKMKMDEEDNGESIMRAVH